MMAVPRSAFEVRRQAREPLLTAIERRVYEICVGCAETGVELASTEAISVAISAESYSTVPGILKRLEAKGMIRRTVYQKGRQVCIVSSGKCTAPPADLTPHWTRRSEKAPAPAIHAVEQRSKSLSEMIEAKARSLGKPLHEFLMDCVYVGFHEIARDQEA